MHFSIHRIEELQDANSELSALNFELLKIAEATPRRGGVEVQTTDQLKSLKDSFARSFPKPETTQKDKSNSDKENKESERSFERGEETTDQEGRLVERRSRPAPLKVEDREPYISDEEIEGQIQVEGEAESPLKTKKLVRRRKEVVLSPREYVPLSPPAYDPAYGPDYGSPARCHFGYPTSTRSRYARSAFVEERYGSPMRDSTRRYNDRRSRSRVDFIDRRCYYKDDDDYHYPSPSEDFYDDYESEDYHLYGERGGRHTSGGRLSYGEREGRRTPGGRLAHRRLYQDDRRSRGTTLTLAPVRHHY